MLELIADDEKEPAELRALGLGEAGEQLVFGVALAPSLGKSTVRRLAAVVGASTVIAPE